MRCRKAHRRISASLDGALSKRSGGALRDHLAECEGCRAVAADFSEMGARMELLTVSGPRTGFTGRLLARIDSPQPRQGAALRRWVAAFRPAPVGVGLAAFFFGVVLVVLGGGEQRSSLLIGGRQRESLPLPSASLSESDSPLIIDGYYLVTLADESVDDRLLELLPILEK